MGKIKYLVVVIFVTVFSFSFSLLSLGDTITKSSMEKTVNDFYSVYLTMRPSGLPSDNEQQKLNPYFADSLQKLFQRARNTEDKYMVENKDTPPLVEGDIFTSLFEGATSFKLLSCKTKENVCFVEFQYSEKRQPSPTIWNDKVYLIKSAQVWRIDNIEYLGNWQFMHKGKLRELLNQVIKNN